MICCHWSARCCVNSLWWRHRYCQDVWDTEAQKKCCLVRCHVPGRTGCCLLRLQDVAATPALLADFRNMRARMQAEGLFRSSKAYYACKAASTLALAATAVAILAACGGAWAGLLASAALLALFWQQTGWLAHDFLHHQVFADRRLNNAAGYVLGNVCQVRPPAAVSSSGGRVRARGAGRAADWHVFWQQAGCLVHELLHHQAGPI